jgi:hypothetical protein
VIPAVAEIIRMHLFRAAQDELLNAAWIKNRIRFFQSVFLFSPPLSARQQRVAGNRGARILPAAEFLATSIAL